MSGTSKAAIAANAKRRAQRLAEYLKNPNHCANCTAVLIPRANEKLSEALQRRFCSRSCSNSYSNRMPRRRMQMQGHCKTCQTLIPSRRTFCNRCCKNFCVKRSKFFEPEFLLNQKSEVPRYDIAFHARIVLFHDGKNKACRVCNYTFIVEAAHIKAVKEFPPTALIRDINDISNLVPLCRNHHAEFDHGALELPN